VLRTGADANLDHTSANAAHQFPIRWQLPILDLVEFEAGPAASIGRKPPKFGTRTADEVQRFSAIRIIQNSV
jgi:hypothetical protein